MIAVLCQMNISAGDHKSGALIAQQQYLHCQQASVKVAAFDPRDAVALQTAEAGYAVSCTP